MTDALLVAPQHVDEGLLASMRAPSRARCAELMPYDQTAHVCDLFPLGEGWLVRTELKHTSGDVAAALYGRLSATQHALTDSTRVGRRAQKHERFVQEMKWLAENGRKFSGKWIALEGERLLAVGGTSREVFSKVADRTEPPLVIRIDEEELPFAGW